MLHQLDESGPLLDDDGAHADSEKDALQALELMMQEHPELRSELTAADYAYEQAVAEVSEAKAAVVAAKRL